MSQAVSDKIFEYLKKTMPSVLLANSEFELGRNQIQILRINAKALRDVVSVLKNELGFDQLLDVVAVDLSRLKPKPAHRFELDYFLYNTKNLTRVQLKVLVAQDDHPEVDSIFDFYFSADWAERECYDMMGISFRNHPNLKRLLMWEEFIGHPLRKDYPYNHRQPIPVTEGLL